MKIYLRIFAALFLAALLCAPAIASAHAAPVSSDPSSSATAEMAPRQVTIRFSERVDPAASQITVRGPSGATVSTGDAAVTGGDPRALSVPMRSDGNGTYLVSWSVVSADDGHFTKGAYPFAVGNGVVVDQSGTADTEIVQIATEPESLSIAVELIGNGFILAVILLAVFGLRALQKEASYRENARLFSRWYLYLLGLGAILAWGGALAQILVKSQSLAGLRGIPLGAGVRLYLGTTAGEATVIRMVAVAATFAIGLFGVRRIFDSARVTYYEIAMMISMAFFEYYRAVISHATANPFHPHLSVAVNFVHLIEKDFWAGAVGIMLLIACSRRLSDFVLPAFSRLSVILAVDLAAVSVTACYIVWLHLKSFGNLFTTQWGAAFMQLLIIAVLLVGVRLYHVLARAYRPRMLMRYLMLSLAAEFALATLVVYCSSVVIITSPPLAAQSAQTFVARDQGVTISLSADPFEDGKILLSESGGTPKDPGVTLASPDGGTISIVPSKRFAGGYIFPADLLPAGTAEISVTVPQEHGYDANARFSVTKDSFALLRDESRGLDGFTGIMIAIALSALVFSFAVYRVSSFSAPSIGAAPRNRLAEFTAAGMFLIVAFFGANLIQAYAASPLSNPFKAECEADGNMWHLMLPSVAGVPVSQTPREGCMWGMGNAMYQYPDQRQYDYLNSLPQTQATLATSPQRLVAGVPSTLTFTLKNADGTPALLQVDMEKYIHVVIVSKDESVFAHIHPDDVHPLSQAAIDSSTYAVDYTFPKAGSYLVSADYAHGTQLESKQFIVEVAGAPAQASAAKTYASPGTFDGYDVALDYGSAFAGEVTTLQYSVSKDGAPVTDMEPYLSAVAHVSVVKNDLSAFIHAHGEFHLPGAPLPPLSIRNGKVVHSMAAMMAPGSFGPKFDAHLIFPSQGRYTVWTEFKVGGKVIPTSFTVDVE